MKIDLKELEALARAATPGPWSTYDQTACNGEFSHVEIAGADGTVIVSEDAGPGKHDSYFIAAANPAAVLELIALASTPASPPVTPKHIEEIKDILLWPVTEDDARVAREMLQSVHFDLSMHDAAPQQHAQAADEDRQEEAHKLAKILFGMVEGDGRVEGVNIYAEGYSAPDGDVFVLRAAELLIEQAAESKELTRYVEHFALQAKAAKHAQAAQFPPRDTSKPAEQQGIFEKFRVQRTDGSDALGGKHHGCAYFVLDLDHDQHAGPAMRAYANSCRSTHPQLAADIRQRFPAPPRSQALCNDGSEPDWTAYAAAEARDGADSRVTGNAQAALSDDVIRMLASASGEIDGDEAEWSFTDAALLAFARNLTTRQPAPDAMRKCSRFGHSCNCTNDCPSTGIVGKFDVAPVAAAMAPGVPDAAFAQFCDREGYPSDGPFDAALRKAFDAGRTALPPADAAPAWDAAATERLRSIVDLLDLQSSVPEGDLTGYEFSVLGFVRREIERSKAAQPSTAQGDALRQQSAPTAQQERAWFKDWLAGLDGNITVDQVEFGRRVWAERARRAAEGGAG